MSITSRTAITIRNALLISLTGALTACTLAVHPLLTLALGSLFLGPLLSDWLASRFSTHVVYMLRNDRHDVIYVGQTDDTARRMYQHTDGTEHTWWRDIYGYTVWRHCWNDRQSRRIERRLVGVINRASDKNWCDKLLNEQYGEDHQKQARALTIRTWYLPYLLSSHMVDSRSYHSPCVASISIPSRPAADETDEPEPWEDAPCQARPRAEASYSRPDQPTSHPVAMLALPPVARNDVRNEPARNGAPPLRSRGVPPNDQDRNVPRYARQGSTTTADQIRDAHTRRQDALIADGPGTDDTHPEPGPAATTARPVKSNAQRQKEWRERQKQRRAAAESGPTMTSRTRPAPGGGVGEGES